MARLEVPGGWTVRAFSALDCAPGQAACPRRRFGGRRSARNRAVRTLKDDLDRYHAPGQKTEKPSLASRPRYTQPCTSGNHTDPVSRQGRSCGTQDIAVT